MIMKTKFLFLFAIAGFFFSININQVFGAACPTSDWRCTTAAAPNCSDYNNPPGLVYEELTCSPGNTCTTQNPPQKFCYNTAASSSGGGCAQGFEEVSGVCFPSSGAAAALSNRSVLAILSSFLVWIFAIFAIISILAFVISGFQYLLAAGDSNVIETAKRNMTYSIVGVAIGLGAVIIIKAIFFLLWGLGVFPATI